MTACEKGLVEDGADVGPTGQVSNTMLQVRTHSGGDNNNDNPNNQDNIPTVGNTYHGCYVLAVSDADDSTVIN